MKKGKSSGIWSPPPNSHKHFCVARNFIDEVIFQMRNYQLAMVILKTKCTLSPLNFHAKRLGKTL